MPTAAATATAAETSATADAAGAGGGSSCFVLTEADQQKLERFRRALGLYVGTRPFHNFAGNRRQYVRQQQQGKRICKILQEFIARRITIVT
jgi:tRNA U38,U39,U40 pseudouridine synthase TruA